MWAPDKNLKSDRWGFDPGLVDLKWDWFWNKLAYAFVYWNGEAVDLLSRAGPDSADLGNIAYITTLFGVGVDHSDKLDFTGFRPLQPGTGGVTMCSYFRAPSSRQVAVCQRVSTNSFQMELRIHSARIGGEVIGEMAWKIARTSGLSAGADTADTAITAGEYYLAHGRRTEDGTNSIWLGGIDATDNTAANTDDLDSATNNFTLGGLSDSAAIPFTDIKLLDVGWNRALTNPEIHQHARDPFGPFRMAEAPVWKAPDIALGFVPYPNPRYSLTGGMQPMSGGMQ